MYRLHHWITAGCLLSGGCAGELDGDESRYRTSLAGDAATSLADGAAPQGCADITEIFNQSCGSPSCHGGPSAATLLDLTSPDVELRLVGVSSNCSGRLFIDPVAPETSYLLEKLESSAPQCGSTMPYGTTLEPAVLECVRAWVNGLSSSSVPGPGPVEGGAL